jgi:hypothetical protein
MKQLMIIVVLFAGLNHVFGQAKGMNTISPAGSSIESKNLVISWTIGEDLLDFTMLDPSMTGKPESSPQVLEMKDGTLLKVYPTITTGLITVEIRRAEESELRIELIDFKGNKLRMINAESDKLELNIGSYVAGNYLLKISNKDFTDQVIVRVTKI